MGPKPDYWICQMCEKHQMIDPFVDHLVRAGNISYGLGSFGYDIRLADEFKLLVSPTDRPGCLDPKAFEESLMQDFRGETCDLPPNSFLLARSVEKFIIPPNVIGLCFGKSTYARLGVIVNITPLEPCWRGILTIGISNTGPFPVRLYAYEGIAQVLFFESEEAPLATYEGRKYQDQMGIVPPRLEPG